jgi:hypothetical protein
MQGDPHVRFDEQGVETDRLVSPTGEPHDTAPPPDSTHTAWQESKFLHQNASATCAPMTLSSIGLPEAVSLQTARPSQSRKPNERLKTVAARRGLDVGFWVLDVIR